MPIKHMPKPTNGNEKVNNHKWVVNEEIKEKYIILLKICYFILD